MRERPAGGDEVGLYGVDEDGSKDVSRAGRRLALRLRRRCASHLFPSRLRTNSVSRR
jgi:hypothetical protein